MQPPVAANMSEAELEALALPPVPEAGDQGIEVNFRITVLHIGRVDTREQTVHIRMGIVLYWTDPRMVGWTSPILPPTIWGPEVWLKNQTGGVTVEYEQFAVTDATEGRMKRIVNFESLIIMPMDLRNFPFDIQTLAPEWVSISHWRQLDGSRGGSLPMGQSYHLRPVWRETEGEPVTMFFTGHIAEWELHSYTIKVNSKKHPAGFTISSISLQFIISRSYSYYLARIVAPLTVLTIAAHLNHGLPPDQLSSRLANVHTAFIASFALLFVVAEQVPRVNHLTIIDHVIFLSLGTILFGGGESTFIYYYDRDAEQGLLGQDHFDPVTLDLVLGAFTLIAFFIVLAATLIPAIRSQTHQLARRDEEQKMSMELQHRQNEGRRASLGTALHYFVPNNPAHKKSFKAERITRTSKGRAGFTPTKNKASTDLICPPRGEVGAVQLQASTQQPVEHPLGA